MIVEDEMIDVIKTSLLLKDAKRYKIGEIFKITSGGTPNRQVNEYFERGSIPWVKTGDLKVKNLSAAEEFITEAGLKNSSAKLFPKNTVLIAMYGATIGACSILRIEASTNQACAALLPNESVDVDYLYYYLLSIKSDLIERGVGGGQPNISATILKDIEIPLPDVIIQKQIAQLLEEADIARQKRKAANALTDQFLQSAFLSMFGDPFANERRWDSEFLSMACNKITDGTHSSPTNSADGDYKYISAKNIKRWGINLTDVTYVSKKDHDLIYPRCNPEFEDVLYIKDGVTTGIATVNTLKEQFSMLSSVALLKCNKEIISPYYLSAFLNNSSVYESIRRDMGGAAITRLTLEKIKRIKVLIPPISLQQKFASIVADAEQLRQKQKQSEIELENLFQALLQKYFG